MSASKKFSVTAAAAAIVILAGLLAVRLLGLGVAEADPSMTAAHATVSQPATIDIDELSIPAWHKSSNHDWDIDFKTDLDLLAPLGNGSSNAAVWFAQFEKNRGSRAAEAAAMMKRRVEHEVGKILPFDDPLLAEAEPWCDQATMFFYSDIFPIEGWETRLPNLLVPLVFARTWVARGLADDNEQRAAADFRRAIRLGRLLRQEDAVLINDLVGLECIRVGAWGIFTRSRSRDPNLALIASVVVGESAPQRLHTMERVTKVSLQPYIQRLDDGAFSVRVPDTMMNTVQDLIANSGDRRFKAEAIFTARIIATLGSDSQKQRMSALIDELATGSDPILSALATWVDDHELSSGELEEVMGR